MLHPYFVFFFFNDTATTEIYTLSLHDALPISRSLRGKMGIEERVPEFVEEALKARQVAAGLTDVLRLLPQTTMEQLSARFNRCSLRDDSEHVANLAADLGEEIGRAHV